MNKRYFFSALFIFYFSINFVYAFNYTTSSSSLPLDTSDNSVFDDFNAVKNALTVWNDAINKRSLHELEKIYANEVQYYLVQRSAGDCIKSKLAWLQKRPKFNQKIKNISVYTIGRVNEKPDIIAEFKKECYDGVTTKEYDGLLVFRKVGNDWKLIKETDITSEVKRYYNLPKLNLPEGKYTFTREYFKYNKNNKTDSTELLSYKYTLEISIVKPEVHSAYTVNPTIFSGYLSIYSGAIKSTTKNRIINGKNNLGILEISTSPEDADGNLIENQNQNLRFKIVSKNQLILLNEEMPWLYGKPMDGNL